MPVKFQDYYNTLGIERSTSQEEIPKAYRKLARKYHPDLNKGSDAEENFKRVTEAYEVLKDPEKRKRYDTLGAGWREGQDFTPPPGREDEPFTFRQRSGGASGFDRSSLHGAGGFSDFFETIFGGRFSGFAAEAGAADAGTNGWSARGQDREAEITISLEEAFRGATKTLVLQTVTLGPEGQPLPQTKNIEVKIPSGVTPGMHIRLAGQGGAGMGGGPSGDLFLRVRIAPHPIFQLDGSDLQTTLAVTPWEAALGAKIEVPTLDGPVNMTLPPGTQSGKRLRLRGKGLLAGGNERGVLYVVIQVTVPTVLTAKERELFEQLQQTSSFNPRRASKGGE